jgi:hypothetical protein
MVRLHWLPAGLTVMPISFGSIHFLRRSRIFGVRFNGAVVDDPNHLSTAARTGVVTFETVHLVVEGTCRASTGSYL